MLLRPEDNGKKNQFDDESQEDAFVPVIEAVGQVERLFYGIVDDADEDSMDSEDEHRTDGDGGDNSESYIVETSAEVNNGINRK